MGTHAHGLLNAHSVLALNLCTRCYRLQFLIRPFYLKADSILQFILNNLPSQHIQNIYADLPPFPNPSVITGDDYRPDLLNLTKENCLYILELTVRYETNLRNNINHKRLKYEKLIMDQRKKFICVKFINRSVSALASSTMICCFPEDAERHAFRQDSY